MSESAKFPILLPTKCSLTQLIILDAHRLTLHSGVNDVLAFLREKWWIPRGRQAVRSVITKCITCTKVQGKAFTSPPDPPLPAGRVNRVNPFQISGVDLTGALNVKVANETKKCYIVLYTCAVSRAVHLEVAYDLSGEEFLRTMIRFSSRRSYPQILCSDNGSNFNGASKVLNQISESGCVSEYLTAHKIEWKFITPRAAWHGGIWERLIGLTKNTLRKIIASASEAPSTSLYGTFRHRIKSLILIVDT